MRHLFTLFCPLFMSGASFSIAYECSVRNLNTVPAVQIAALTVKRAKRAWRRILAKCIAAVCQLSMYIVYIVSTVCTIFYFSYTVYGE